MISKYKSKKNQVLRGAIVTERANCNRTYLHIRITYGHTYVLHTDVNVFLPMPFAYFLK